MIKIITPVEIEPLTLAEVRQHLRLPVDVVEDELLLGLIRTARVYCENITRRALAEQALEMGLDNFPAGSKAIILPCPPLVSVTEIAYRDSTGVETILLPETAYVVDTDREPGRVMPVYGTCWPVFTPFTTSAVRIRFVAGYENLPATIRHAMLLLIGHWYENREATGSVKDEVAFSVNALLSVYRLECF